ncbi:MAG: flippase-like domain-containing protein [Candidatus Aenigmarchaeota archaeon]|nr:flippase-like domain-containing protein [Candidatus Aenigmarchaeota archaeon]
MLSGILLAVGIAVTVLIAGYFGFSDIIAAVQNANINYIALAVLLQAATLVMLALRLKVIAKPKGNIGIVRAFRVTISGTAMNLLTPVAKIGGEPLKVYLLKKKFGASESSAIVSIDTMTEIVSSFLAVLLIFFVFIKFLPAALFIYFMVFFIVAIIFIAFTFKLFTDFSWLNKTTGWFIRKISKYRKVHEMDYARIFHSVFMDLIRNRRLMVQALSLSFAMKMLEFARMWLVFLALGTVLPPDVVIIIWAVLLILSMIPWLPGGLGLVEFGGISVFIMFGIQRGVAASGVLIDRFISFWFILILGLVIWAMRKEEDRGLDK